jgi:hypothetical protein
MSLKEKVKKYVSDSSKKPKKQPQSSNNTANENNGGTKQYNFNKEQK